MTALPAPLHRLSTVLSHRWREVAFSLLGSRLVSFETFRQETALPFLAGIAEQMYKKSLDLPQGAPSLLPYTLAPDSTTASGLCVVPCDPPVSLFVGLLYLDTVVEDAVTASPSPREVNLDHYVRQLFDLRLRQEQSDPRPAEIHLPFVPPEASIPRPPVAGDHPPSGAGTPDPHAHPKPGALDS